MLLIICLAIRSKLIFPACRISCRRDEIVWQWREMQPTKFGRFHGKHSTTEWHSNVVHCLLVEWSDPSIVMHLISLEMDGNVHAIFLSLEAGNKYYITICFRRHDERIVYDTLFYMFCIQNCCENVAKRETVKKATAQWKYIISSTFNMLIGCWMTLFLCMPPSLCSKAHTHQNALTPYLH